jgi:hypothetical protein
VICAVSLEACVCGYAGGANSVWNMSQHVAGCGSAPATSNVLVQHPALRGRRSDGTVHGTMCICAIHPIRLLDFTAHMMFSRFGRDEQHTCILWPALHCLLPACTALTSHDTQQTQAVEAVGSGSSQDLSCASCSCTPHMCAKQAWAGAAAFTVSFPRVEGQAYLKRASMSPANGDSGACKGHGRCCLSLALAA